jgi:hypothetical protein
VKIVNALTSALGLHSYVDNQRIFVYIALTSSLALTVLSFVFLDLALVFIIRLKIVSNRGFRYTAITFVGLAGLLGAIVLFVPFFFYNYRARNESRQPNPIQKATYFN